MDDIKDDIHHSSKKIQPVAKDMTSNSHILGENYLKLGPEMELNLA